MLCGIALLGMVTALLAAWFLEQVARAEHRAQVATRRDVEALAAEVARLRAELAPDRELVPQGDPLPVSVARLDADRYRRVRLDLDNVSD